MSDWAIPLSALIISAATLIYAAIAHKKTNGNNGRISGLDIRIEKLENRLRECEAERKRLLIENVELMRKLVNLS